MTSAFHDPVESELREGWTEAVLEELVIHVLGGVWGSPGDEEVPSGHVRVSVLRGTEFKEWDEERGRTAAERAVTRASLERRELRPGDLVIEISGGGPDQPVGRILLIDETAVQRARHPLICSNFCRQIRLHPEVDPAYVALVLRHRYERGDFNAWQSQTTNIRNLDFKAFLAGVTLPLPPLAEQRRIAARAGELLTQARQVRARLAKLPPAVKRFRQSALAAACSGRLTEDWRVRHRERESPRFSDETEWQVPEPLEVPEIPESWTLVGLNDLVTRVQYGVSHRADGDAKTGVPVLRMPNIQEGRVDRTHLKYVDEGLRGLDSFKLKDGDILFNRTNSPGLVGKAAVFEPGKDDEDARGVVFASYLVRLVCDGERMLSRFLCSWINSPWGRQWAHTVRRDCVSQSNINSSKLRRMPVPTPPLAEQHEIVRWLEKLFRFADAVDVRIGAAMARADRLSQAVLEKAFRGDLVPTESELARLEGHSYEPAWALMDRIKSGRKPRTGRRAQAIAVVAGTARRGPRNRTVAVWDADQVLVAFRQACWGAGTMSEDELIRRVADRLGVERLGKKVRGRLVEHLVTAIERRIVVRRGERLEGATPTFARYDDEYLLHVVRTVLRGGIEYDVLAAVRSVASYLGYGQVTAALRSRMESLFLVSARRGTLVLRDGKLWRRG